MHAYIKRIQSFISSFSLKKGREPTHPKANRLSITTLVETTGEKNLSLLSRTNYLVAVTIVPSVTLLRSEESSETSIVTSALEAI